MYSFNAHLQSPRIFVIFVFFYYVDSTTQAFNHPRNLIRSMTTIDCILYIPKNDPFFQHILPRNYLSHNGMLSMLIFVF